MSESRPPIPAELKREVLIESGHRCAIPTCRQTPVDVHHIVPWEQVKVHNFENLIALCPTCHRRVHSGEIDRKSILAYKRNLSIMHHRYCDFERRLLIWFHNHPKEDIRVLESGFDILVLNLLTDGLIVDLTGDGENEGKEHGGFIFINGTPLQRDYKITPEGRQFIEKWMNARSIE